MPAATGWSNGDGGEAMRSKISVSTGLLVAMAAAPGLAAPATSEGASAIAQGYAAYFSQAVLDKGYVTVTPQGDDYLVTWDLQKIIDLAKAPPDALRIDKYSYVLRVTGDDSWTVKADHFPTATFNVPTEKGRMSGTVDLNGFHLDTSYDGGSPQFLLSHTLASLAVAKIKVAESTGPGDIDVSEAGLAIETKAKAADGGVDLTVSQSIANLSETVLASGEGKSADAFKLTLATGAGSSDAAFAALKAREIGDLWKFVVAHAGDGPPPPDLKARVAATLPVWKEFRATVEVHDMAVDFAIPLMPVHAEMKALSETVAMSGFTPHAFAEVGVKISDLSAKAGMLPPWAASIQPASIDVAIKVTVEGMDEVARLALDDPNFGGKGDLTEATQEKIREIMLNGHPKLVIAPGRLATPALEIAYEGELTGEGDQPAGTLTLTANGLDKTQALIQEIAKTLPDAQKALLGVAFLKGLATTGADGRLVWKVELSGDGGVTVNGNPMPTGK